MGPLIEIPSGISGIGAIDLLNKAGADCIIYDGNEKLSREDISKKLKGAVAPLRQIILIFQVPAKDPRRAHTNRPSASPPSLERG